MLSLEWKKLLIKQKGLFIIGLMILLKVILTLQQGYDSDMIIDRNPEAYATYINLFEGKLTEAKEQQLKDEYYAVTNAKVELEELIQKWKSGSIGKESYEQASAQYYERLKNQAVFNKIYNQYYYAKENPEKRYLMDERGWETLLSNSMPDFVLLLTLIIVLTPLFCYEYENEMDMLLLSSSKGKYQTGVAKLTIAAILAATITLLFTVIEYVSLAWHVGMENGHFPLQSLQFFASSAYDITLNQALLLLVFIRMIGAILFAGCICLVSIISKKTIITLFVSSILVFLPYILFSNKILLYYLPLPSGLLIGTGYLWGTIYNSILTDQGDIEKIVQFQAIRKEMFLLLMGGYIIEIILVYLYSLKKYAKLILRTQLKYKKWKKSPLTLIFLLISSLIISGCENQDKEGDLFTYESDGPSGSRETAGYAINLDVEKNIITARHIGTDEEIILTREPFEQEEIINTIFIRDGWCYYVTKIVDVEGIRIYGINLKDFQQKVIYNSVHENSEDFFGLYENTKDLFEITTNNSDWKEFNQIYSQVSYLVVNDNNIYYVMNSELVQINRKTGKEKIVARGVNDGLSMAYHNGDFYYIDYQYRLSVFKEQDDKVQVLDSIYTDNFYIEDSWLHYRSLLDDKKILIYKLAQ